MYPLVSQPNFVCSSRLKGSSISPLGGQYPSLIITASAVMLGDARCWILLRRSLRMPPGSTALCGHNSFARCAYARPLLGHLPESIAPSGIHARPPRGSSMKWNLEPCWTKYQAFTTQEEIWELIPERRCLNPTCLCDMSFSLLFCCTLFSLDATLLELSHKGMFHLLDCS
jgi:hypothetical protein